MALQRFLPGARGGVGLGLGSIVPWKPDVNGKFDLAAKMGDDDEQTFRTEMGIAFSNKVATNTINAFTDPAKALQDFQTEQQAMSDVAAREYKRYLSELVAQDVPKELAMQIAKDNAQDYLNRRMEIVKLKHPYADSVEKLIELSKGTARRGILTDPNNGAKKVGEKDKEPVIDLGGEDLK